MPLTDHLLLLPHVQTHLEMFLHSAQFCLAGTTLLPTVSSLESVTCCNKLHVLPSRSFWAVICPVLTMQWHDSFSPLDCVGACVYERNAQDLGLLPSETVIPIISVQDKHVIIHFHVFSRQQVFEGT